MSPFSAFFLQNKLNCFSTSSNIALTNSECFKSGTGFLFAEALSEKKDLYKILGVKRSAPLSEIKSAFRKLSLKFHPDKDPSPKAAEIYNDISEAYNILMDQTKKKIYDKEGFGGLERFVKDCLNISSACAGSHSLKLVPYRVEKGFEQSGGENAMDPMDFYKSMFGGGIVYGEEEEKTPPAHLKIYVSLEDLYFGTELYISYTRPAICDKLDLCLVDNEECSAKGMKVVIQRLGPGFVVKNQISDDSCVSRGKAWKSPCRACPKGIRVPKTVELTAIIEPGSHSGHQIIFEEQGEEFIGKEKGDLILTIEELPHERYAGTPVASSELYIMRLSFVRNGDDLETSMHIDLKDALVGFSRELKHLDKSTVILTQSNVTHDGAILRQLNRGMPKSEVYGENGNLLVSIKVRYPISLSVEQKDLIKTALADAQYHTLA
ncbi:putative DnaJ protein [Cardiosporidium cionae]|uniref:DnaJ protein n=1 Tax=Cardiosporidium cionae TaxID=476202 RepID=A0ABQ7JDF7_9APIC|nr:putative DnaJ protein [Cardiosporidium cionae]|eukprot:KAF8822062.1 putative DnaJ protein [Cardiosporidium cionae]